MRLRVRVMFDAWCLWLLRVWSVYSVIFGYCSAPFAVGVSFHPSPVPMVKLTSPLFQWRQKWYARGGRAGESHVCIPGCLRFLPSPNSSFVLRCKVSAIIVFYTHLIWHLTQAYVFINNSHFDILFNFIIVSVTGPKNFVV